MTGDALARWQANDTTRQIEKALDVLRQVQRAMLAEAEMNAAKHMAPVVRPVPLAGAVSSLIVDYEAWLAALAGEQP